MKKLTRLVLILIVALLPALSPAQPSAANPEADSKLQWQFSPFTWHFRPSDEHKNVWMVGLEREYANGKLDGLTLFSNSFGQPTVYLYPWGGAYHHLGGIAPLSFKWTAGLMYGYVGAYQHKVPLNYKGLSPVAIPALVYQFQSGGSVQADFLGTAGMMFQFNLPMP